MVCYLSRWNKIYFYLYVQGVPKKWCIAILLWFPLKLLNKSSFSLASEHIAALSIKVTFRTAAHTLSSLFCYVNCSLLAWNMRITCDYCRPYSSEKRGRGSERQRGGKGKGVGQVKEEMCKLAEQTWWERAWQGRCWWTGKTLTRRNRYAPFFLGHPVFVFVCICKKVRCPAWFAILAGAIKICLGHAQTSRSNSCPLLST